MAECKDSNIPDDGKSICHMKLPSEGSILNVENRRLLPNSANGTHILEGPQNRYSVILYFNYIFIAVYLLVELTTNKI